MTTWAGAVLTARLSANSLTEARIKSTIPISIFDYLEIGIAILVDYVF